MPNTLEHNIPDSTKEPGPVKLAQVSDERFTKAIRDGRELVVRDGLADLGPVLGNLATKDNVIDLTGTNNESEPADNMPDSAVS